MKVKWSSAAVAQTSVSEFSGGLIKYAKKPLENWKLYQTKLPSHEEVKRWFTDWPEANIGIVTGKVSNIFVLDVDGEAEAEASPWLLDFASTKHTPAKKKKTKLQVNESDIDDKNIFDNPNFLDIITLPVTATSIFTLIENGVC